MPHLVVGEHGGKDMGAVRRAVVGHHAGHANPAGGEVAERARQEARGDRLRLIGQNLGVGEARAVVDRHVHGLPADAAHAGSPVAVDAVPGAADLAQLFDVQVQQVARGGPLVALGRLRRVEATEAIEAQSSLLADDRAHGELQLAGDPQGAVPLTPTPFDLPPPHTSQAGGRVHGAARAVPEPGLALGRRTVYPLADGLSGDAELPPQLGVIRPGECRSNHELHSPGIGQACSLMGVHRSSGGCRLSV